MTDTPDTPEQETPAADETIVTPAPLVSLPTAQDYGYYQGSQGYPSVPPPSQPMTVVPRQSVLYVLASFFVPGLGSMLNGQTAKGVWFFVAAIISIPLIFLFGLGIITSLIVRVWACVAAHTDTQAWNRAHGFIS